MAASKSGRKKKLGKPAPAAKKQARPKPKAKGKKHAVAKEPSLFDKVRGLLPDMPSLFDKGPTKRAKKKKAGRASV